MSLSSTLTRLWPVCLLFAYLTANAQTTPDVAPAAAQTGAVTPVTPAVGTPPATPASPTKPFDDVIKDAKVIPGFFNLYQKDEKVWIELKPGDFEKPFFF